MASPYRPAEEMLRGTSLAGMSRTSAPPGPNMFDAGPTSKVSLNNQDFNNERLLMQNRQQNMIAGLPQAQAGAIQGVRKQQLIADNAEHKAQDFALARKSEMLEVMDSPAIREMSNKTPLEMQAMRKDVAVTKAAAMGINPDLIA